MAAFLRGKCGDAADIEDCVQEAMLRAAQMPHLDRDRTSGLLKKIAFNVAMDGHRERQRRARAFARLGVIPQATPDELALDHQHAYELAARAAKLSLRERQALRGRLDGFNPSETAARLGVPAKTVHLALSRARTALKAAAGPAVVVGWVRRHCGVSARTGSAMTAAVAFASLTFILGHGDGRAPLTHPAPPPLNRVLVAGPEIKASPAAHQPLPSPAAVPQPPAASRGRPAAAPPPTTLAEVVSPDPHTVQMGIKVTVTAHNGSFLSSLEACLQPGGISLDPHHAGCSR